MPAESLGDALGMLSTELSNNQSTILLNIEKSTDDMAKEMKQNTEQLIYQAAEDEFVERGFDGAKMMSIARRAGVSHSMLHYYFENKEQLFQKVIRRKTADIMPSFSGLAERSLSFVELVGELVRLHFDKLGESPRLPLFILNTWHKSPEDRERLLQLASPLVSEVFPRLATLLEQAIQRGEVRAISLRDLLMTIFSLNVGVYLALPILGIEGEDAERDLLHQRREECVRSVLAVIRVD